MHMPPAFQSKREVTDMASVTFSMKAPADILRERGLGAGGAVQSYIDGQILAYCEPYVPKASGALIASGYSATKKGSGKVVYGAPYAAYQYYGKTSRGNAIKYNGAPMRGSYWFERMKAVYGDAILNRAAALAGGTASAKSNNTARVSIPLKQTVKTVLGYRNTPVLRG